MAQIDISQLRKSYGSLEVIHGIDLAVRSGEFVVILGPSGCGKSTLLRMIAGLESITGGEISLDGVVVNTLEPRERGCAMVFQNYALYPHMTVAQNIGYSLKVAGVARGERTRRVEEVARMLALDGMLERLPGQLSGGQRQRVAMGRAMIREPKVFLYDEPLSNLDAKLRVQMRMEIRRLHQRLGATSIFVTHDQVEAMTLADRIVVMNRGTIDQVGTPREVYGKPATTYVGGFVGTPGMNFIEGRYQVSPGGIVLPDGQLVSHPGLDLGEAGNEPVTLGIRAESLHVNRAGQGIEAKFIFAEDFGSSQIIHVEAAGSRIAAHMPGFAGMEPGETVWLSCDPSHLHYFGADGRRIG